MKKDYIEKIVDQKKINKTIYSALATTLVGVGVMSCVYLSSLEKKVSETKTIPQGRIIVTEDFLEKDKKQRLLEESVKEIFPSERWGEGKLISKEKINFYIDSVYQKENLSKEITKDYIHSIVYIESGYNPNAVSRSGAVGLMQLMKETWEKISPDYPFEKELKSLSTDQVMNIFDIANPFKFNPWENYYSGKSAKDPYKNIENGIKHLSGVSKYLRATYKGWNNLSDSRKRDLIAATYNCGTGRITKNNFDISKTPSETRDYVKKYKLVMNNLEKTNKKTKN